MRTGAPLRLAVLALAALGLVGSATAYRTPRVAAVDYSGDTTLTRQEQLARYKFIILGGRFGSTLTNFTNGIRARNSGVPIALYAAINETRCTTTSTDFYYPVWQAINKADFWLHKADGTLSQWSTAWNSCDLNLSSWGRRDASGRTWQEYKALFDYNNLLAPTPAAQWLFSDNTFGLPREDADWKRIGTNQLRTESDIIVAQRAGQAAYWAALRAYNVNLRIIGNADNDLSSTEYKYKLNGAFFEGAMGRSWSIETWSTWSAMMNRYRAMLSNTTSPHAVFFQVYGSTTDYKLMRYGLASSLMVDGGYYVYLPFGGTLKSSWYDEYGAPIGGPLDAAPTGPAQNGIWKRTFENGMALVNPSKTTTASIYVGSGYRRLSGMQDPVVNNGQPVSTVTLGPREGLILVRQ